MVTTMRYATTVTIAIGLMLAIGPLAQAESMTETILDDPAGDAGPAGTELGSVSSDVDIAQVTLSSDEEATTTASMELVSFDMRPPDTYYGVAFHVDDALVFAGYAHAVLPFPPFIHEGYFGCQVVDHEHDCTELDGHELAGADGFQLTFPTEWTPAGATLEQPSAAVFTDPYLPGDPLGRAMSDHVWPANVHDMATTDASHDVPTPAEESTAEEGQTASNEVATAGIPGAAVGLIAVGLAVTGLAGWIVRRPR